MECGRLLCVCRSVCVHEAPYAFVCVAPCVCVCVCVCKCKCAGRGGGLSGGWGLPV